VANFSGILKECENVKSQREKTENGEEKHTRDKA